MNITKYYDFDITTGSSIQAGALFDILDDLSSIGKRKINHVIDLVDGSLYQGRSKSHSKEDT
jgi:hypothetical protein